jgi:hypothetical protein
MVIWKDSGELVDVLVLEICCFVYLNLKFNHNIT